MKVINGNNIEVLKQYPDNYFDAIVTDPPYGLGKEPDAIELMKDWIEHGYHEISGSGFMGKEWDAFVPQPLFWKEVYRVLKHGGHVVAFYGTRTYDWGVMAMRFAGFEVRDCIQWLYGSGFPKSHNVGKAIDAYNKFGKSSPKNLRENRMGNDYKPTGQIDYKKGRMFSSDIKNENIKQSINNEYEGWGSALKPANEPIVLARKPLEKGLSIAENVLKWGTGGINIDGCRVSTNENLNGGAYSKNKISDGEWGSMHNFVGNDYEQPTGRFPANIILTHHPECVLKGLKKVKSDGHHSGKIPEDGGIYKLGLKELEDQGNIYAENGEETVEAWECVDDCPIKILDEQSGISKSTGGSGDKSMGGLGVNGKYGKYALNVDAANKGGLGDTGGASRFFYCAKASKSERNNGLDGFEEKTSGSLNFRNPSLSGRSEDAPSVESMGGLTKPKSNFHPTVKPVKLMQYLVRMITPPYGKVLDPFCGSGTTGIACKLEGFDFVGIEQDAEYCKIAEARITNYVQEEEQPLEYIVEEKDGKTITQTSLF